jgi:hypothetical protein
METAFIPVLYSGGAAAGYTAHWGASTIFDLRIYTLHHAGEAHFFLNPVA